MSKMLNRNPVQRITINEMKRHPFFAKIDWNKLARREVPPPIVLSMDDSEEAEDHEDDEESKFLKSATQGKEIFKDKDYDKSNKTLNRVRQFTFAEQKK